MVERKNVYRPTVAIQDNVRYDLQLILDNLAREVLGEEKAVFVYCPVCQHEASVPILPKRPLQTVKCHFCSAELKFKMMGGGVYKVRSPLGLEYVVGTKRTFRDKAF